MVVLTAEQTELKAVAERVAREEISPRAAAIDGEQQVPQDLIDTLYEAGLLRIVIPRELGGLGQGLLSSCLVVEEVARASGSVGNLTHTTNLCFWPFLVFGDAKQRRHVAETLVQRRGRICFALTEPNVGSDAAALETRAIRDGDEYVLTGRKSLASDAALSELLVIYASTDPAKRGRGTAAFIVPQGTAGLSYGARDESMGMRGAHITDVIMEGVRVPASNMVGQAGEGVKIALWTLERGRLTVSAIGVGLAQGALDCAVRYAKERTQFGQPIANFQGVQFMLADMAIKVETARIVLQHIAAMIDAGQPRTRYYASVSKCFSSDAAMSVTTDAVQVLGGYGYLKRHPVERMMRDAKTLQIYEGTNQIQRMVVARYLLQE